MAPRVLFFHYVLTNTAGEELDSSRGGEPLGVLEGSRQIIPGLEEELFKMQAGDKKKVDVAAAQAYGPVYDQLKITIGREKLPQGDIQVGTRFRGGKEPDAPIFMVTKIEGEEVHLDGNHPLAGQDLSFDVEVTEIREATEEEQQHGHPHGAGGHQH